MEKMFFFSRFHNHTNEKKQPDQITKDEIGIFLFFYFFEYITLNVNYCIYDDIQNGAI